MTHRWTDCADIDAQLTAVTKERDEALEALADMLGWDNCECGHPACERGKVAQAARAFLAKAGVK